ncbi:hypothetical protein SLEP1_g56517 [Rubroshorea leprosula]|uniref:Uncharacterized protein n=1 Tax=Rubroshorea leprosula TaxID=152421 RepID=A0AAV5MJU7_9ROSI|nr:hypothetical protein SLEP1_g56517 [Rubroshorea leprosula]
MTNNGDNVGVGAGEDKEIVKNQRREKGSRYYMFGMKNRVWLGKWLQGLFTSYS